MKILDTDYALNIELSEKLGTLKVVAGELIYCHGDEAQIKTGIIQNLGIGQLKIGDNKDEQDMLKAKMSLIFPELLFLNDLSLKDNLKLYFDSTQKKWDQTRALELFEEYELNMQSTINSLTLNQKIDFLICRSILAQSKIMVLDSAILQLDEYDQDRIMAELILHCRENNGTLIVTQYSERLMYGFPGRVFGKAERGQLAMSS